MSALKTLALGTALLAGVCLSSVGAAETRGSVNVYVCRNNQAAYNNLNGQAASLGARLNSYNQRAAQPTSSPAVYQSRVREAASLRAEVSRYNAAAQRLAASSPVPPSSRR